MKLDYLKQWGAFALPLLLFIVSSVTLKADETATAAPTPVGTHTSVYLDSSGSGEYVYTAPPFYNPATDSIGLTQQFFNCNDVNDTIRVFITITNISLAVPVTYFWDTTDVIVVDTIAPFVNLNPNFALSLNAWGYDTLRFNDVNLGSTDNCAIDYSTLTFSRDTVFGCSDVGGQIIWIAAKDFSGNVDSMQVTLTVTDALPPTLVVKDDTLYYNSLSQQDTIRFSDLDDGSYDNCGLDSATLNSQSYVVFGCADLGQNVINVTLYDVNGNSSNGTANIWVLDTVAPVYTKNDTVLYVQSSAISLSRNDFVSPATGGCYPPVLTIFSDTTFDCVNSATNPNYIVFQYANGPLDTVVVTVLDTVNPTLILKSDTIFLNGIVSSDSISFTDINDGSFDNCTLDSALLNGSEYISFSCADTGVNTINVQLWDISGNLTTGTTSVVVLDTVQPQYTKNDLTVYLILSTDTLTRSDFLSTANGGCFPPKLTIFSDTVIDCGKALTNPNYIRFQFTGGPVDSVKVEVYDTIAPALILKTHNLYLNNGFDTLTFADVNNGSVDNCSLDTATLNGSSSLVFDCSDLGSQNVLVTLYDPSGNASTGSVMVSVQDTATPNYLKTPHTAYLISDTVAITRGDILSNVSGGCFPPTVSILSDTIFDCADVHTNPNYVLFSLNGGAADSVPVTVLDTLAPSLLVTNDTIYLNSPNAQDSVSFADIDLGSADNCGIDSTAINGMQTLYFSCVDTGAHVVIAELWDASLNKSTDSVFVYVLDTNSFNYTKFNQTVYVGFGADTLSRDDFISTATAGCIVPVLNVLSDTIFDCTDIANNPSYIRFQYTNGPLDSVEVTVLDTLKPVLTLQSDTLYVNNSLGTDSTSFTELNTGSLDNCGLDSALVNGLTYATFSCADTGANQVSVQLWDVNGNLQSGTIAVYVLDTVAPVYVKTPYTAYLISDSVVVTRDDILSNATGGCFPPKLTLLNDTVFSCAAAGANLNYIRFQFTGGPVDSVSVMVLDTLLPNLILTNDTIYVTASTSLDSVRYADVDLASTDNCGIDSVTVNNAEVLYFSCSDTGRTTITVQVWDASGNTSVDSVDVFVLDTVQPSYVKTSVVAYLNTDSVVVPLSTAVNNVQGGCFTPEVMTLSDTVFYCADISTNPNYIRFSVDGILDSVEVTVLDSVSPLLALKTHTVYIGATDTLRFADIDNNSSDNCALDSAQLNGLGYLVYDCDDLGFRVVNVNLFDVYGNVSTSSVGITIVDTITPIYQSVPFTTPLVGSFISVSRDDLFVNTSASCKGPNVTFISDTTFDCLDIANNPNYVLYNLDGQLDSVQVTIVDTTAPTFSPKAFVNLVLSSSGTRALTIFDVLNGFPQDNCAIAPGITINPQVIDCSNTNGFTPVTVTASDIYGNTDSVTVNVLAQDITPPTILTKTTTFYLDSLGLLNLDPTLLVEAKDSCGIDTLYANKTIFTCADIGASAVTVTAIDVNNNMVNTNVQITVLDTIAPDYQLVSSYTVYLDASGTGSLTFSDISPNGASDACGISATSISKTTFSCMNTLPQVVTAQVTDFSGNTNTQQLLVSAQDTVGPTIFANNIIVQIDSITGKVDIDFFDAVGFVGDNCELDSNSLAVTPNSFNCDSLGVNNVLVQATDIYGNSTEIITTVEVQSYTAKNFEISGPNQVCENAYNVRYNVFDFNASADYVWNVQGGDLISTGFRGREAYVHWNTSGNGMLTVVEQGGCSIGSDTFSVNMDGQAPDTAHIAFWNPDPNGRQTTIVCTDQTVSYYQWGYDRDSANGTISVLLDGETKNAYYNFFLEESINDSIDPYRYWCETSFDGNCWTRSYLFSDYPVNIEELNINSVKVWPVPFKNELNISAKADMAVLEVYDMYGKLILKVNAEGKRELELRELDELAVGTYTLRVFYRNGSKSNHKIVHIQ